MAWVYAHQLLFVTRVTPTSAEAFIVRLFREKNQNGFLKAFSDQPEYITSGMSPLRTIMKELQLRTVHIYPRCVFYLKKGLADLLTWLRFHADVKVSLDRKQPDLVELHQHMTEPMSEIHHAIVQCMTTTLSEVKRTNTSVSVCTRNTSHASSHFFRVVGPGRPDDR